MKSLAAQRSHSLPEIFGVEAAECGLACLAMVGRYHGHDVDLNGLRQRFPVSMAGSTMLGLKQIAEQLGFITRAVRSEAPEIKWVKTPAILHWNLDHFVVLKSVGRSEVVIHDPSFGSKRMSFGEFAKGFSGVAMEFSPAADFKPVRAKVPIAINSFWSKLDRFWSSATKILALSVAGQLLTLLAPFQLQLAIDEALPAQDRELVVVIAIGFALLAIFQTAALTLRDWTVQVLGSLVSYHVVSNLVHHLLRLPVAFFERRHIGDLVSRVGSAQALQQFLARDAVAAIIDGSVGIIAALILLLYDFTLALIVFAGLAATFAISLAVFPRRRAWQERQLAFSASEQSHLMESMRISSAIKLAGGEAKREGDWQALYARVINANLAAGRLSTTVNALQSIVSSLQLVLIVYVATLSTMDGRMTAGMLLSFLAYRQLFMARAELLVLQLTQFRFLRVHLERMGDIIATPAETMRDYSDRSSVRSDNLVKFDRVSFRYGYADRNILTEVSFVLKRGDFVAITGPSGSGKTTFLKLLGLYEPTAGQILLQERPADLGSWQDFRTSVGFVGQGDQLISGSVADNIAFLAENIDMEAVRDAAVAAQIDLEIQAMPMGYRTLIGDMGSSLSAGQKQRVLLARALYRKPSILVLDEGTANLDQQNEMAFANVIEGLPITKIVVAHRSILIQRATSTYELAAGALHQAVRATEATAG